MEKSTSKRKEREREARREAILEAAARVLSVKSYYEATLDEIAAEAELAKGTLYNYYKDKQSLFFSLLNRGFDGFQQRVDEAIAMGGTLEEQVRRQLAFTCDHVKAHKYMFRIVITTGGHLSEDHRSQLMDMIVNALVEASEKLADHLASLPETRHLPRADLMTGCKVLFAASRQIHMRISKSGEEGMPAEEIENYTRFIVRGLTAEKPEGNHG